MDKVRKEIRIVDPEESLYEWLKKGAKTNLRNIGKHCEFLLLQVKNGETDTLNVSKSKNK